MSFIGIICEENSQKWIRTKIEDEKIEEISILFLEETTMENVKNITFETIIIMREVEENNILKQILKKATYLIMNTDIKNNFHLLEKEELTIITYGFNSKASITASSVSEENIILCVQRDIVRKNENIFEVQEIDIKVEKEKVLNVLGIYAFLILYGKK